MRRFLTALRLIAGDDRLDPVTFAGAALLDSFGLACRSRLRELGADIFAWFALPACLASRHESCVVRLAGGRQDYVPHPCLLTTFSYAQ